MKKKSKAPKVDPYLEGLMAKLLERLVSLDKKMDTVLGKMGKPVSDAKPQPPRRDRVLYEAICADCSKVCEVPFQPTENRAVYCKECWAKRKSLPAGRQGGGQRPANSRPGMPVLTPVALPPKPAGKLHVPTLTPPPVSVPSKQAKKSKPAKKAKKKKSG